MNWAEIDRIPQQVREGNLSFEKAAWKLLTEVYINPHAYTGENIDEDSKSDFIISIQPKIKALIERYNENTCPFSAFFTSYVQNCYISFKRTQIKRTFSQSVISDTSSQLYEEASEKYENSEKEKTFEFADSAPSFYYRDGKIIDPNVIDPNFKLTPASKTTSRENSCWPGKTSSQKMLTVLALRSCCYINDFQIKQISKICGYPPEILEQKVEYLSRNLEYKRELRNDCISRRNYQYFFHRKYELMLSSLIPDSPLYETLKEKNNHHIKAWSKKNSLLLKNRFKLCPTAKTIALAMGMSERQVSNYISSLKKAYDRLFKDEKIQELG